MNQSELFAVFILLSTFMLATFICWIWPTVICRVILAFKERLAQPISSCLPAHQHKAGTPTFGGVAIFALLILGMAWCFNVYYPLILSILYIGFWDDLKKVTSNNNRGLSKTKKFWLLFLVIIPYMIYIILLDFSKICMFESCSPEYMLEAFSGYNLLLKLLVNPVIFMLFIAGYDLTDGLDGLLGNISLYGLCVSTLVSAPVSCKGILQIIANEGGDLTKIAQKIQQENLLSTNTFYQNIPIIAGLLAFLRYNNKPARIFMGDCGSMALGGIFAALYIGSEYDPLYLYLSIVPIINFIAVALKIGLSKIEIRYGMIAPIHHELEKHIGEANTVRLLVGITVLASAYPAYSSFQANMQKAGQLKVAE